jgi:hypothetical protein
MITLEKIRVLCKTLPGTTEGTSYGTPGFRVAKKLFARLHGKEDAIVLLLNTVQEQQDLIASDPMSFYITDHYEGYAAILVRPTVDDDSFFELLELAWRRVARKRDLSEHAHENT